MRGSFSAWGIRAVGFLVLAVLSLPATAALVSQMDLDVLNPQQMIIVGVSPDSPAAHVDPNTTTSPLAGVGSIFVDTGGGAGFGGTGSVIGRNRILTAAHLLDLDGDGSIDVAPGDVTFYLNYGSDQSHAITASNLYVHPDWTGFDNPVGTLNDDVAVIVLESPVPAGVPIYGLDTTPFEFVTEIMLVGYGLTGDGDSGYISNSATFYTKRWGKNEASMFFTDDEGSGAREIFFFDFDSEIQPPADQVPPEDLWYWAHSKNWWRWWDFDGIPGLGNTVEVTIGPGDSGGPSLISDGNGGYNIFGINTFGFDWYEVDPPPRFSSAAGGMLVSAYQPWIESIPEPSSIVIWLIGGLGAVAYARRRRKTAR